MEREPRAKLVERLFRIRVWRVDSTGCWVWCHLVSTSSKNEQVELCGEVSEGLSGMTGEHSESDSVRIVKAIRQKRMTA